MQKTLTTLILCLFCLSLDAQTQFVNPILGGDYPDPTIMREGEDYYMTHSAFDYQPGLVVFHSKDLVHWEPISYALKTYLGSIWAPDICKYDGKYYIYFTVARQPRTNYVVWADSPYGPWSEPIDLKIANIDPCHVVGEDGQRWLFMSGGRRAKLAADGLSVIPGTEEQVYPGWQYPEEWLTEGLCLEGPKLKKIGEYFYYFNAEGGTAGPPTSHMVVQARSKSIDGPWEDAPNNPLVHTYNNSDRWWSKGHGSIIDTPDGEWMIVYHSYENGFYNIGRQTLMEPITLGEDGWFHAKMDGAAAKFSFRKEDSAAGDLASPLKPAVLPERKSRLNEFRVGLDWKFYKSFEPERISVADGVLTMTAKGTNPGNSSPFMFVAGDHRYEVEVEVELQGEVSAGIVLYYNSTFFMGTGFNKDRRLRYRKGEQKGGAMHPGSEKVTHLWLRLRNFDHIVTGEYSYDGKTWERETWGNDISGYHHNTLYEFQSVLPGLFAAGEGKAVFRNFKYKKLDVGKAEVLSAMKRATQYMMDSISNEGGFVWSYLLDGSRQWGEMEAYKSQVWVQSPGTPEMGHLMLDAYHATKDEYYYECAEKVARCLMKGQLPCGGWNYMFDLAGEKSIRDWYNTIGKQAWRLEEFQHYYGNATFDDGGTIQAAEFLLRLYLEKKDKEYKAPLDKVINFILESQYENGGWPQRYPLMYDHVFEGRADYSSFITINDDVIPDAVEFLQKCRKELGMKNLEEPISRAMHLFLKLQQPKPLAGWADQYTPDLKPAHARSYEPRSVNTGTTVRVIRLLFDYYFQTGEKAFLAGIPDAVEFLRSQKLGEEDVRKWGRPSRNAGDFLVPRFIDPDTQKPLYVHRVGSNVGNGHYFTDENIAGTIGHYSSATYINTDQIMARYDEALHSIINYKDEGLPVKEYYFDGNGRMPMNSTDEIVNSLTEAGYWLAPISQISNPYKPLPKKMKASTETKYQSTMVGDQYDTSPFSPEVPVMGITLRSFIRNMSQLIGSCR